MNILIHTWMSIAGDSWVVGCPSWVIVGLRFRCSLLKPEVIIWHFQKFLQWSRLPNLERYRAELQTVPHNHRGVLPQPTVCSSVGALVFIPLTCVLIQCLLLEVASFLPRSSTNSGWSCWLASKAIQNTDNRNKYPISRLYLPLSKWI